MKKNILKVNSESDAMYLSYRFLDIWPYFSKVEVYADEEGLYLLKPIFRNANVWLANTENPHQWGFDTESKCPFVKLNSSIRNLTYVMDVTPAFKAFRLPAATKFFSSIEDAAEIGTKILSKCKAELVVKDYHDLKYGVYKFNINKYYLCLSIDKWVDGNKIKHRYVYCANDKFAHLEINNDETTPGNEVRTRYCWRLFGHRTPDELSRAMP